MPKEVAGHVHFITLRPVRPFASVRKFIHKRKKSYLNGFAQNFYFEVAKFKGPAFMTQPNFLDQYYDKKKNAISKP